MEEDDSNGEEQEKPRRKIRKTRVTTVVLAVLAIALILSYYYFFEDSSPKEPDVNQTGEPNQEMQQIYRGYVFEKAGPLWRTKWRSSKGLVYNLEFRFHPEEVAHIAIEGEQDERINSETVFLTIDGEDTSETEEYSQLSLAVVEISSKLVTIFERNVIAACTTNSSEACETRPTITCETEEAAVIYFKDAPEPRVVLDGNCITIEGKGEDSVKAADKLIYKLLRIVE